MNLLCRIPTTRSLSFRPFSSHVMRHFKGSSNADQSQKSDTFWPSPYGSPVYSPEELQTVAKTHFNPKSASDRLAYGSVQLLRLGFDVFSGYKFGGLTESKVLKRAIFLETIAGVPGFVAGILRHLKSLRLMKRDHGWIYTLLQEAENERMHLLTFIKLYQPSYLFRMMVILSQGIFMNGFFFAYLLSPRFCHRFVGYLEEEAVKTYSGIIRAMDDGLLDSFQKRDAPEIAKSYWKLAQNATCRDLILAVRADEAHHRDVNHTFANISADETNPFIHKSANLVKE